MYHEAEMERRHDLAELFAWGIFHIIHSMPAAAKGQSDWRKSVKSLDRLLNERPPPGWDPEIAKKRKRLAARMRARSGS